MDDPFRTDGPELAFFSYNIGSFISNAFSQLYADESAWKLQDNMISAFNTRLVLSVTRTRSLILSPPIQMMETASTRSGISQRCGAGIL